MSTTRTNRRLAFVLAALLGLGVVGVSAPAGADIGDITSCTDPTHGGSVCDGDDTPDGPDDFTSGGDGPEEPDPEDLPEAQPEPDDGDLPPAEVDGTVVAEANFTG